MLSFNKGIIYGLNAIGIITNSDEARDMGIDVDIFNNNREQGFVFTLYGYQKPYPKPHNTYEWFQTKEIQSYCIYAHRSNDTLIVNGKKGWKKQMELPYKSETQEDYYISFNEGRIYEAVDWILKSFREIIEEDKKKKTQTGTEETKINSEKT